MALVLDASVSLKLALREPDSHRAEALLQVEADLLVPDFWLGEATNVLWLQVRRKLLTPEEARDGLALLCAVIEPTNTTGMGLHEIALDIGIAANHSTYDTLYVAFAIAVGASHLVVSDRAFVQAMSTHHDPVLAGMLIPLDSWARSHGVD